MIKVLFTTTIKLLCLRDNLSAYKELNLSFQ